VSVSSLQLNNQRKKDLLFAQPIVGIGSGVCSLSKVAYLPAFLWIRTYIGQFAKSTIPWTTPDGKVATQKYLAI
jgi:hypothetical protein